MKIWQGISVEMKEHPIIFSSDMVRAISEDRKIMTRRKVKPQPIYHPKRKAWDLAQIKKGQSFYWSENILPSKELLDFCPYGQVGDRLWVRETAYYWKNHDVVYLDNPELKSLLLDTAHIENIRSQGLVPECVGKWIKKSSIFMPRWASRITLEITNIKVERLQEITRRDTLAEGINLNTSLRQMGYSEGRTEFKHLWDSINGKKYPWKSNPFVWCLEFKKI